MSDCISNLYIASYRGIHDLYLNDLKKINILTGDNNSGKTSVLELLNSFSDPRKFREWSSLLRMDSPSLFRPGLSFYEGFYDLFDINSDIKKIDYIVESNELKYHVLLSAIEAEEEMTIEEYYNKIDLHYIDEEDNKLEAIIVPKLELQIDINETRIDNTVIYEGQRRFPFPKNNVLRKAERKILYISPTRHAEGELFLSEVLDKPDLYEEMLSVLREYDEDIISINYDRYENKNTGKGVYKILSKTHRKALPLNVYGDGMKKAILLMSAVIAAQNGILLLDEFETAIHTSAMNKTFEWILKTCIKLNVQLFLTSHSKEAINKVLKCAPSLQEDMAVYTLYKDGEGNSVRRLSGKKAIEVQDDMGLELR